MDFNKNDNKTVMIETIAEVIAAGALGFSQFIFYFQL